MDGDNLPGRVGLIAGDRGSGCTSIARREFLACQKPILFFANALGDHLLTRPTVLALTEVFEGRLGYMGAPFSAERFYPDADFRCVCPVAFSYGDGGAHDFEMASVLSYGNSFDAIISLNPWHSPLLESVRHTIAPKPFVTLGSDSGVLACNPQPKKDMAAKIFAMAKFFRKDFELSSFLSVHPASPHARACADYIFSELPQGKKVLCVHTWTHDLKRWPTQRFKEVIAAFILRFPEYVALVVDPADTELDTGLPVGAVFTCDGVDLDTATDLVARSDLFLGIDSYFLHVADFSGVPSVGIFGPTNPERWGASYSPAISLRSGRSPLEVSSGSVLSALVEMAGRERWDRRMRGAHERAFWALA